MHFLLQLTLLIACWGNGWILGPKTGGFAPPHPASLRTVCVAAHDCTPRFPLSKPHPIHQFESTQYNPKRQLNGELGEAHETNQTKHHDISQNTSPLLRFSCLFFLSLSWPHSTISIGSSATALLPGSRQTCAENLGVNLDPVSLLIQSGLAFLSDSERI